MTVFRSFSRFQSAFSKTDDNAVAKDETVKTGAGSPADHDVERGLLAITRDNMPPWR